MKKITILSLVLLGLGFFPLFVSADIIPANSHPLERCAKVVNLDKFGLVLFGSISGPTMGGSNSIVVINNNECISKGYKFNTIDIYWTTEGQNPTIDNGVLLIKDMDVYGGYVNDSNRLAKETVEYSISKPDSWIFSLWKSKVISEYNNGVPVRIETFSNDGKDPIVEEVKKEVEQVKKEIKPVIKKEVETLVKQEVKPEVNKEIEKDVPFESDEIVNPKQDIVKNGFWQKVKCFFGFKKNC